MSKVKKYRICQSCGMPLKNDPAQGGTEKDGSKSAKYCSYCYVNGAFTQPDFTAQDMKEFCIDKMVEMKFPRILAKLFAMPVPKLERWRQS